MPDGILGAETAPGKYEDNSIPGAKDGSEAYDARYWTIRCRGIEGKRTGPRGLVTSFVRDPTTAVTKTVYGPEQITHDGTTTCVVIPRTVVTTCRGVRAYFEWYDHCCTVVGIGDCAVILEFVKSEDDSEETRTPIDPLVNCVTDWPRWAIEKLAELIKAGLSSDAARAAVGDLVKTALRDRSIAPPLVSTVEPVVPIDGASSPLVVEPKPP